MVNPTDQAALDALLVRLTRQMRSAFLEAVHKLGDRVDIKQLAEYLRQGRVSEAIDLVNAQLVISGFRPVAVQATYSTVFAARETMDAASQLRDLVRHDIVFDQTETEALTYLRRNEMSLIRELSAQALASVRTAITRGQAMGRNPLDTARDVRQFIGLTERQINAVLNYRRILENMQSEALDRALRDRRFDATVARSIRDQAPLTKETIDKLVSRYQERYLKYRAETIAKTEALRAANGGAHLAWEQQVRQGKIPSRAIRRKWLYTHDAKTREAHRQIPGMNKDGVGLFEPFETPDGPFMYPGDPAGPPQATINCRCTLLYSVDTAAMREAA